MVLSGKWGVIVRRLTKFYSRMSRALEKKVQRSERRFLEEKIPLEKEFRALKNGAFALKKLIHEFEFETVLDVGSGAGHHADILLSHQKAVTAIDYGKSIYFERMREKERIHCIVADFNSYSFETKFDCVWCSHILEHQLDVQAFLLKVNDCLKEGGILAITVPPLKHEIVGGHVSLWNPGLLLYRLVLAGLDCRDASVLAYGYNISVIVRKRSIEAFPELAFDAGDIRRLRQFLPEGLSFTPTQHDDPFDGLFFELNWFPKDEKGSS